MRNLKSEITMDVSKIQKIIGKYFKTSNKIYISEEMDKFLYIYKLISNANVPIFNKIERETMLPKSFLEVSIT